MPEVDVHEGNAIYGLVNGVIMSLPLWAIIAYVMGIFGLCWMIGFCIVTVVGLAWPDIRSYVHKGKHRKESVK